MSRILVMYGTSTGHTAKVARALGDTLPGVRPRRGCRRGHRGTVGARRALASSNHHARAIGQRVGRVQHDGLSGGQAAGDLPDVSLR